MTMRRSTRDAIRAGISTARWSFIATFGLTATGWLSEVAEWAQDWSTTGDPSGFPSLSTLAAAAVSAAAAALAGLVATIVRYAQSHQALPGRPPHYHD